MSGFSYVAVGDHPTDVVVITTGRYAEIFSFIHYEKVILEQQSSSSTGTHEEPTQHMEEQHKRKRSQAAIRWCRKLYKQRKIQKQMNN